MVQLVSEIDGFPYNMPEFNTGDPIVPFDASLRAAAFEVEQRTDEELAAEGRQHPDPVIREQALYQLIQRSGVDALPVVEAALFDDKDSDLRINLLWAIEGLPGKRSEQLTVALMTDSDTRVQEWARVFSWEKGWTREDFRRAHEASSIPGTFDQTIFLHIKCHVYVRVDPSNKLWAHVLLSPQTLARVYGQALACPITETRERELVIAKTLRGLHSDGSEHYEAFLFKGFTERTSPLTGNFNFEAHSPRPFYLSGRADDVADGVVENVPMNVGRVGNWFVNPFLPVKHNFAIEYVRGLFNMWAYVNVEKIRSNGGLMVPGNSVLSTLHDPRVSHMTNAFLTGSFKGKVVDWNGDGILDLNYWPAHATAKGEVDSDMDGEPDSPGVTVCTRRINQGS